MSSSIPAVHPGRVRVLKPGVDPKSPGQGPVVYWMFRDQRLRDNWALIHAVHQANQMKVPVAIAFNLFHQFKGAKARHLGFMLRGLKRLHSDLHSTLEIPFFLFQASSPFGFGEAVDTIPNFLKECGASLLVTDFSPLREVRQWKEEICKRVSASVSIQEVDAHNVVPVWVASDKLEYGARTIRNKINKKLAEYLVDFPELGFQKQKWSTSINYIDWDNLISSVVRLNMLGSTTNNIIRQGAEIPELEWCEPGERAGLEVLVGEKNGFLKSRLKNYATDRNNPMKPKALSGLSPYLHFGQISAQRCALEAQKVRKLNTQAVDVFLEELVVRRELADNFCFYQPHYDSLQGAWEWARKTLMDHAADKREHLYTREQLEKAQTADQKSRLFLVFSQLWNASQLELTLMLYDKIVFTNYCSSTSMYWAKKILEWTSGPEEALATSIYLNDKYHIDGRDPNGYVGCMWSICGVHDQGWKERPIFGKIRYMNYAGCKRKFDVDGYIAYVKRMVGECKKRKAENLLNEKAKELRR
ncbi:CPD photolyase family protein [Striga asiatica]|uniref:Deoxyribodipyrimidine photo-lyase n=1 Tax=Striga asiatica TaxID=4170 RepID=A0A5A7P611_STRAF|nr:CPD photolyase family protein [Striga asiatica]